MFVVPVSASYVEELSTAVKEEIARQVAEKVYKELDQGSYLERAHVLKTAKQIANNSFNLLLLRDEPSDSFQFRIVRKDSK